jgi:type IV pilus assembly protein PilA
MRSARRGFTLIELLIVVVIIGILAAVAITSVQRSKEKAYISAMQSDLRNLANAQASYFAGAGTFAADPADSLLGWHPSPNVTVLLSGVSAMGYSAEADHASTSATCLLSVASDTSSTATNGVSCR